MVKSVPPAGALLPWAATVKKRAVPKRYGNGVGKRFSSAEVQQLSVSSLYLEYTRKIPFDPQRGKINLKYGSLYTNLT